MVCCIATYIYTHYFIVVAFLYHLGPTNGLKKRGMFQASVQSYNKPQLPVKISALLHEDD